MKPFMSAIYTLFLLLGCYQPPTISAARAQACGCGKHYVYVGNERGEAVKGVTVEFLDTGAHPVWDCRSKSPARQTGEGQKFKFLFGSPEGGYREPLLLRVSAPGYVTYEERGELLKGCGGGREVVLKIVEGASKSN